MQGRGRIENRQLSDVYGLILGALQVIVYVFMFLPADPKTQSADERA